MRISVDPSSDPADYEFHHVVRVRFAETDAMGIVHHSRYLPLLEEARVAYLRHIGHPYQAVRDEGIEFAVLEVFVQYRLPLRFDDVVDIHVSVGAVGRATFQMAYLMTVDGQPRATAVTAHGGMTTDGRATRLPTWFRDLDRTSRSRPDAADTADDANAGANDDFVLASDRLSVAVSPVAGGRVTQITADGVPVLIGPGEGRPDPSEPLAWGAYPMVPWCGRIRRGRFTFDGTEHQLPINFETHAIHGVGFRSSWTVVERSADRVRLELALPEDETWPFGGIARHTVAVADATLRMELSVTAVDHAMPASLGWHPWFRKPTRIDFRPSAMYRRDEEWITVDELVPVPHPPFDDCFVNGDPVRLTIAAGGEAAGGEAAGDCVGLVLTSGCTDWTVYDMPSHATCVEPQTAPPDAFNIRPHRLEPGDSLSAWFEIAIAR